MKWLNPVRAVRFYFILFYFILHIFTVHVVILSSRLLTCYIEEYRGARWSCKAVWLLVVRRISLGPTSSRGPSKPVRHILHEHNIHRTAFIQFGHGTKRFLFLLSSTFRFGCMRQRCTKSGLRATSGPRRVVVKPETYRVCQKSDTLHTVMCSVCPPCFCTTQACFSQCAVVHHPAAESICTNDTWLWYQATIFHHEHVHSNTSCLLLLPVQWK